MSAAAHHVRRLYGVRGARGLWIERAAGIAGRIQGMRERLTVTRLHAVVQQDYGVKEDYGVQDGLHLHAVVNQPKLGEDLAQRTRRTRVSPVDRRDRRQRGQRERSAGEAATEEASRQQSGL